MPVAIVIAETEEQFTQGAKLIRTYAESQGFDLEFQGFSSELATINTMYGRPKGALLLATNQNQYVGVVALREFRTGIAEMKRMFVPDQHQKQGIGRQLALAFLEVAQDLGYDRVWLDSIPELSSALSLYKSLGFRSIEPYRYNPHPEAVFLEYSFSERERYRSHDPHQPKEKEQ